jgi:hypothetical protein
MRPVSAPAVDTGGTSSASVELPPPLDLNALTGSAGPLGMGRRRRSTGGRRGQRRGVLMLARMLTSWTGWPAPSTGMRTACSRPRTSTSQSCRTTCASTGTCCERSPPRRTLLGADTPRGGHSSGRTLDPKPAAVVVEELAAIAAIAQAELERAGPHPPAGPAVPDASRRGCRRRSNPHVPVIFGGPG